jgi:hypothetical protein
MTATLIQRRPGRTPKWSDDFRKHRLCRCIGAWCPRVRVEQAIAWGLTPDRVMVKTGCDEATYVDILARMDDAA